MAKLHGGRLRARLMRKPACDHLVTREVLSTGSGSAAVETAGNLFTACDAACTYASRAKNFGHADGRCSAQWPPRHPSRPGSRPLQKPYSDIYGFVHSAPSRESRRLG